MSSALTANAYNVKTCQATPMLVLRASNCLQQQHEPRQSQNVSGPALIARHTVTRSMSFVSASGHVSPSSARLHTCARRMPYVMEGQANCSLANLPVEPLRHMCCTETSSGQSGTK